MNVTTDQIIRFQRMMEDVAKQRDCTIRWTHTSEAKMEFSIKHDDYEEMPCLIYWDDASSLTDAGVRTWACYFEHRLKRVVPEGVYGLTLQGVLKSHPVITRMNDRSMPQIAKVIYSEPATIVFWSDKTKTVVKCQDGDEFDPEKGLTMAIAKKLYGNKGRYFEEIKKWTEPYYAELAELDLSALDDFLEFLAQCQARRIKF